MKSSGPDAKNYRSFADLSRACAEGRDFHVQVRAVEGCPVAILAPHGGRIEPGTSQITRAIAGSDISMYLLEGVMDGAYSALHLTSHLFDDERCLNLLAACDYSISVHGCSGSRPQVLVGGLDDLLKSRLVAAIESAGMEAFIDDHRFPAKDKLNVVNRNRRRMGAQLEFTAAARKANNLMEVAAAIRKLALTLT